MNNFKLVMFDILKDVEETTMLEADKRLIELQMELIKGNNT